MAANATSVACHPQNPFGAAKPREAVLANRSGKSEREILLEEVQKEKLKVRAPAADSKTCGHLICSSDLLCISASKTSPPPRLQACTHCLRHAE